MKIKMSEVIAQRDSLKSSISQTKSQLSSAKKKLKSAANSEALKGDVKDAIDNKITNYQVPLLTNYVNSLDVISQGYDNLISTFKSIVSENSDSAIIDTDVLQQMVDKFDSPLEQLKTSSDAINKAIDDVADIVTLTKVTTDDAISEFRGAKKVLTNTIKDMGTFNNTVFTSEAGEILEEQNTQLSSLSDLGSSSYTSKKAKDFYKKTAFKTEVKETKLVVSGKARRDQLKNELAKNLYDSKYSGYLLETTPLEVQAGILLTKTKKSAGKGKKVVKILDSTDKALKQKRFIGGREMTVDSKGRVKLDGRFLYKKPVKGKSAHLYSKGTKEYKDIVGEDFSFEKTTLYNGRKLKANGKVGIDWKGVGTSGKEAFKSGLKDNFKSTINPLNEFKGFKEASNFSKAGKVLGFAGTVMTIGSNIKTDFIDDRRSSTKEKVRNFAVDTTVDVVSSSSAAAAGAAIGTAVGGPLGTVAGAAAGIAFSWAMNKGWFGKKSVNNYAKDGLKGLAGKFGL
ncbi:T7SS effector LXG polymorphic toxin [Streptococcus equinus]|uniref:LXG domain of WXG superfamily protein n=1 Tax=Streptococcus equinus TaxID=1335 RepID=A0A1G9IF36_STREI|nr:T7SS effector LXG polymorphic toxin [Streptococcus equinus]SDL23453.1 LXG domain of WXG superfamily protein [Streptococcus equinus]